MYAGRARPIRASASNASTHLLSFLAAEAGGGRGGCVAHGRGMRMVEVALVRVGGREVEVGRGLLGRGQLGLS